MSLFRPNEPSHLLTGTIRDVEAENSPNPRYTVDIQDTNHPVPMRVYAWAATDRFHRAAAQQWEAGDQVMIENSGGIWSIIRHEPGTETILPPTSSFQYDSVDAVTMSTVGVGIQGQNSRTTLQSGQLEVAHTHQDGTDQHLVLNDDQGFSLSASGVSVTSQEAGPDGGPAIAIARGRPPQVNDMHRVVIQANSGSTPMLNPIPVDFNLVVGPTDMPERVRGTITLNLTQVFGFASELAIDMAQFTPTAAPTLSWSSTNVAGGTVAAEYRGIASEFRNRAITLGLAGNFIRLDSNGAARLQSNGIAMPITAPTQYPAGTSSAMGTASAVLLDGQFRQLSGRGIITDSTAGQLASMKLLHVRNSAPGTSYGRAWRAGDVDVTGSGNLYIVPLSELLLGFMPASGATIDEIYVWYYRGALFDVGLGQQITEYSAPLIRLLDIRFNGYPLPQGSAPRTIWA